MNSKIRVAVGFSAAAAAILAAAFLAPRLVSSRKLSLSYVTQAVTYADVAVMVNESGTINVVNEALVGSEVSGMIGSISVNDYSRVRKGDVLATVDPTTFRAAVGFSRAALALAQARLHSAQVSAEKMKGALDIAMLTVQKAQPLVAQGLASQGQLDADRAAEETARQDFLSAQAAQQIGEAQVTVAENQLAEASASLSRTTIRSPIDGIVLARGVTVGQSVASSQAGLFTLAASLADMQVDATVDEADVGSVKTGQRAVITVSAYPTATFSGTVLELRASPAVVQNAVTYDAVVAVHDGSARLLPGMTARIGIRVGVHQHVLAVPLVGTFFRPLLETSTAAGMTDGPVMVSFAGTPGGPSALLAASAPGSRASVWVLRDGRPSRVQIVVGVSDGRNTEIMSGDLHPDDRVIVEERTAG